LTAPVRGISRELEHEFPVTPLHSLAGRDIATERDDFFIRTPRVGRLLSFLADAACIAAAALVTFAIAMLRPPLSAVSARECAAMLALYAAVSVLSLRALHLYIRPRRTGIFGDLATIVLGMVMATAVVLGYLWLTRRLLLASEVVMAGSLDVLALVGWRAVRLKVVERGMARGHAVRHAIIVGAGRVGQALARVLEHNPQLGYVVKGFLDEERSDDARWLGGMEQFRHIVRTQFVDEVIVTIPSERELVQRVVEQAQEFGLRVRVVPELFEGLGLQAPIDYLGRFPTMELHRQPIPKAGLWAKRALDLVAATLLTILVAPAMALLALLIKLDSRGPVLYRSPRVGKKGRRFTCYKFRTMVTNADAIKGELRRTQNYRTGPTFKIDNDPRITRVGRWIRRYSLDELPQLFNVLLGDMSLVGPRPHPVDDFEQYCAEHMARLHVKPGLTGLWQVMARRDPSFDTNMRMDLEYINNWTLALDFKILLMTLPAVLRGNGE
jgi:exopolysaccharide biosynthesis polyprenyl glycosylphosphotransferase